MSALSMGDRHNLEKRFRMSGGYVLNFSDRSFGEIVFEVVSINIHDEKYADGGTSKANKLRAFWKVESNHTVGKLILGLIDYDTSQSVEQDPAAQASARSRSTRSLRMLITLPNKSGDWRRLWTQTPVWR
jgi:hypothetical protein